MKDLQKIPALRQKKIIQAITVLAKDPLIQNNNIKRLRGVLTGMYRLWVGGYRVVYILDEQSEIIFIKAILLRNEKTYK